MSHSRFTRSFCLVVTTVTSLGILACGSSGGDAPDGGAFEAGGFDANGVDSPPAVALDAFALDEAGATSTCKALDSYAKCNTSDPCADLTAKSCFFFDGVYSTAGRKALSSCYGASAACSADAGDDVVACLMQASLAVTPDSAQKKLATDFCAACSSGSTCASDFYSDIADDAGNIGIGSTLGLSLINDATIEMLDSKCVTGLTGGADDCGSSFASCVGPLIDPSQCSGMSLDGGGDDSGTDADPGGA